MAVKRGNMSFFQDIPLLPPDPILGIPAAFAADKREKKINLGIGIYKTAEGLPYTHSSVIKAEKKLLENPSHKEYLPIEGDKEFIRLTQEIIFGKELFKTLLDRQFAAQTVGGTSALRVGAETLSKLISKSIFIPQPTWANHRQIFEYAGMQVMPYPYYNPSSHCLDFEGMCQSILKMPKQSIILFHACCHNPTGIDPSPEQWQHLSNLVKKQQLIPYFDMAYQGLGEGLDEDALAVRLFARDGHEMIVAASFSKNFTLYAERIGHLTFILSSKAHIPSLQSHIKSLIRGNHSNPPLHGAKVISTILQSNELEALWKHELFLLRKRLKEMRFALTDALNSSSSDFDFSFLRSQKGLFSFIGLTAEQVSYLKEEKGIYMPNDGRINVAGLNIDNIPYVTEAILSSM